MTARRDRSVGSPPHPAAGGVLAALVAVLMLSWATVQSLVMQAAMASPAQSQPFGSPGGRTADPMPLSMPGMAGPPARADTPHATTRSAHAHHATCPFCAAAVHAPLVGDAARLPLSAIVAFVAFSMSAGHGPRGPPRLQPRARDPPPELHPL